MTAASQFVAFGGIVLGEADNLRIHDNLIQNNGLDSRTAVCGIYVLHGENIAIENNLIRANGKRIDDAALAGIRAGIAVQLAGAVDETGNVLNSRITGNAASDHLAGGLGKQRTDLPKCHPDTWTYDVFDKDGKQLAIFIWDPYARSSKRGGAWMNTYVSQSDLTGDMPVVANHLNIPKPSEGKPTLLTWDEVTTAFHEFGHALHGFFQDVRYPYYSMNVPRDFVEYPSQVNEMWADWPEVLAHYAKHYQTGEAMPQALLDKVIAASKFNQGFATTEYLEAAMLDQRLHQAPADKIPAAGDVMAFEADALKADGFDYAPVPPRYRTPYFSHIMGGYAAGYYAYIWSEVLGVEQVGIHDNFFELGGHSLLAVQVIARVRIAFAVDLSLGALLRSQTIDLVAQDLEEAIFRSIEALSESEAEYMLQTERH